MVRHLSSAGHQVTVVSLSRCKAETIEGQGIGKYCHEFYVNQVSQPVQTLRMFAKLASQSPSSLGNFYSTKMHRQFKRLLQETRFDLIFVHCSSVAQYVENCKGIPKILDFGDMDSQKWLAYSHFRKWPLSWGFLLEGKKLQAEEKRLARKFDLCTCTTRMEYETLQSYRTGVDADWFPNGVDHEYFSPSNEPIDRNVISFIGRMDYYPNQECVARFCRSILPRIQVENPDAKFLIIGADPSLAIRKLGELPGVTVTGSVADVRPYVRRSSLMVAPLNIARGTQNKILEAMAMGVPVVCSRLAAAGVDAIPEEHFLTATDDDEYVRQIQRIMNSPDERTRLSNSGQSRMRSHHNWDASMKRMDSIITRCLSNFRPAEG